MLKEPFSGLGLHLLFSSIALNSQSGQLQTAKQESSLVEYVKIDAFTATLIGLCVALIVYHISKRQGQTLKGKGQYPFLNNLETGHSLSLEKKDHSKSTETTQSTPSGKLNN